MGAYQVSNTRGRSYRAWFFVTVLVCSKAPDEHRDDDPHKTECAFNDHHALYLLCVLAVQCCRIKDRVSDHRLGLGP